MLYYPKEMADALSKLADEMNEPPRQGSRELAQRVLDIDADNGPALSLMARVLHAEGDLFQAEAFAWRALAQRPCSFENYHGLADILEARGDQAPQLVLRLRHLGLWKLAMSDEIPADIAAMFRPGLESDEEAADPDTYAIIANTEDDRLRKNPDPAEITKRLRPYVLLNDLEREAAEGLENETLANIREHAAVCAPLFYAALREWVLDPEIGELDHPVPLMLIAILGEIGGPIGGPELIGDFLELADAIELSTFAHANWAIYRLGERHPPEALRTFREAIPDARLSLRCALAEQLNLLPDIAGVTDALASLLDDFSTLEDQPDRAFLPAIVIYALREHGDDELADKLLKRSRHLLSAAERETLHELLEGDPEFVPRLLSEKIPEVDITDLCQCQVYMDDEDAGEIGEFDEDEEFEPRTPVKPQVGRNDPCWCGSGKKYKKCHLDSDEKGEKMPEFDPIPNTAVDTAIRRRLANGILEAGERWHNPADFRRARSKYFDDIVPNPDDAIEVNGFLQWYAQDFRDSSRLTLLERYITARQSELTPREREILEAWRDSYPAVLEAESAEPGRGVHFHDIGTGESLFVSDVTASRSTQPGDWTLCRIEHLDGKTMFVSDSFSVPPAIRHDFLQHVDREARYARLTRGEYIRRTGNLLYRVIRILSDNWLKNLQIVNREGDALAFCHADYSVLDEPGLLSILRSLPELKEEAGTPGEVHFAWLEIAQGPRTSHGHIQVAGDHLRLEAQSRPRLQRGRELLESNAGRCLQHLEDTCQSLDEIKQKMVSSGTSSRHSHPGRH